MFVQAQLTKVCLHISDSTVTLSVSFVVCGKIYLPDDACATVPEAFLEAAVGIVSQHEAFGERIPNLGRDGPFWTPTAGSQSSCAMGHPVLHHAHWNRSKYYEKCFLVWSPNGLSIATYCQARLDPRSPSKVAVWDAATGDLRLDRICTHGKPQILFSPDNSKLAYTSSQGVVNILDIATGRLLHSLCHHESDEREQRIISFTPASNRFVTEFPDSYQAAVWDMESGAKLFILTHQPEPRVREHEDSDGEDNDENVTCRFVSSPDGRTLMLRSDELLCAWELSTGSIIRDLGGLMPTFSPDGRILATIEKLSEDLDDQYELVLRDIPSGTTKHRLTLLTNEQTESRPYSYWDAVSYSDENTCTFSVVFNCNSTAVATFVHREAYTSPCTLQVWNVATGALARTFECGCRTYEVHGNEPLDVAHCGKVVQVKFSPDSKVLAVFFQGECALVLWDLESGRRVGKRQDHWQSLGIQPCRFTGCYIKFSPDSKIVATVTSEGGPTLWDVATGEVIHSLNLPIFCSRSDLRHDCDELEFSADGGTLVMACTGYGSWSCKQIFVWDTGTGHVIKGVKYAAECPLKSCACNPDGTLLATAHGDCSVAVWEMNGQTVRGPLLWIGNRINVSKRLVWEPGQCKQ